MNEQICGELLREFGFKGPNDICAFGRELLSCVHTLFRENIWAFTQEKRKNFKLIMPANLMLVMDLNFYYRSSVFGSRGFWSHGNPKLFGVAVEKGSDFGPHKLSLCYKDNVVARAIPPELPEEKAKAKAKA